jgi:DNA-binding transcriptional MerR regulator
MLIGEVSRRAGISARMLRHYDWIGLVSPTGRTVGGYREYSDADIQRLFEVESLRSLGLSLRDLGRALNDSQFTPGDLIRDLVSSTRERIEREQELLRRLRQVQDSEPSEWVDVLGVISLLRALGSDDPSSRQRSALAADHSTASAKLLAQAVLDEADPNVAGALRWALLRSTGEALEVLAPALDASVPEIRRRAVAAIAEVETDAAAVLLVRALSNSDSTVRSLAALALGARGEKLALAELVGMVVVGTRDVEAGETLGSLARAHDLDDRLAVTLAAELDRKGAQPDTRLRLVQALAELRGPVARNVVRTLTDDSDRAVAMTAVSVARLFARADAVAPD